MGKIVESNVVYNVSENGKSKSSQITFTLRRGNCPTVHFSHVEIPQQNVVKYLCLHFDGNWPGNTTYNRKETTRFKILGN